MGILRISTIALVTIARASFNINIPHTVEFIRIGYIIDRTLGKIIGPMLTRM